MRETGFYACAAVAPGGCGRRRLVEGGLAPAMWEGREAQAVRAWGTDWRVVRLRRCSPGRGRRGPEGEDGEKRGEGRGRRSPSLDRRAGGGCGGAGE